MPPQVATFDLHDGYYEMRDGRVQQYAPALSLLTPNADDRQDVEEDIAWPLLRRGEITKDEYDRRIAAAREEGEKE